MKIGLISINMYTKGLNYACPVHTFAFQQFLLSHGIESVVLDYKPNYYGSFEGRHPAELYRRLVERTERDLAAGKVLDKAAQDRFAKHRRKAEGFGALEEERARRYDRFWDFIDTYYVKTEKTYDSDMLEIEDPGFDCYICVTDVIWKYQDVEGFDRGYFLASSAMENKWKIAYAASRGVPKDFNDDQYRQFFHFIDDIDYISVRERSLKEFIEKESDKEATLVVDPVLLNDASLYEKVAIEPEEERYVLVYYAEERSPNTLAKAVEYAKKHGLKIVETTNLPIPGGALGDNEEVESVFRYDIGPAEWLGYIQHADCVFTNSFHGTCFSILFEKEFYVGTRHGDKIANLLATLGLEDRMLNRVALAPLPTTEAIDYGSVKERLAEAVKGSAEFILDAINEIDGKEKAVQDYEAWKREQQYPILYKCQSDVALVPDVDNQHNDELTYQEDGTLRYMPMQLMANDGLSRFRGLPAFAGNKRLAGWKMRFKVDNRFFLYLSDGSFVLADEYDRGIHAPVKIFKEGDRIPFIPVNGIGLMVAKPVWEDLDDDGIESLAVILNSGAKGCSIDGEIATMAGIALSDSKPLDSGSLEFDCVAAVPNNGCYTLPPNPFVREGFLFKGWKIRAKCNGVWYWIVVDGTFLKEDEREKGTKLKVFPSGVALPSIPSYDAETVVLEAVWGRQEKKSLLGRIKRRLRG